MAHTETVLRKCPHTGTLVLAQVTLPDEEHIVCLHGNNVAQDMEEVREWLSKQGVAVQVVRTQDPKTEFADGEIFTFDGKTYQVREFVQHLNPSIKHCEFCAFFKRHGKYPVCAVNFRFACSKYKRSDLKWVYFKRVE